MRIPLGGVTACSSTLPSTRRVRDHASIRRAEAAVRMRIRCTDRDIRNYGSTSRRYRFKVPTPRSERVLPLGGNALFRDARATSGALFCPGQARPCPVREMPEGVDARGGASVVCGGGLCVHGGPDVPAAGACPSFPRRLHVRYSRCLKRCAIGRWMATALGSNVIWLTHSLDVRCTAMPFEKSPSNRIG